MKKTTILDLISRKLTPFMLLFGLYLVANGHVSPGGGFQAGVVIASGVILMALGSGIESVDQLFSTRALSLAEALAFFGLLAVGIAGVVLGVGFLGPVFGALGVSIPKVGFVFLLNALIGLKVGAGISVMCIQLLREE